MRNNDIDDKDNNDNSMTTKELSEQLCHDIAALIKQEESHRKKFI